MLYTQKLFTSAAAFLGDLDQARRGVANCIQACRGINLQAPSETDIGTKTALHARGCIEFQISGIRIVRRIVFGIGKRLGGTGHTA